MGSTTGRHTGRGDARWSPGAGVARGPGRSRVWTQEVRVVANG